MSWFTKKLTVPETNGTKTVETVQTWRVDWFSLGKWNLSRQAQAEFFTSEESAQAFRDSLINANALLRNEDFEVSVRKAK